MVHITYNVQDNLLRYLQTRFKPAITVALMAYGLTTQKLDLNRAVKPSRPAVDAFQEVARKVVLRKGGTTPEWQRARRPFNHYRKRIILSESESCMISGYVTDMLANP